MKVKELLEASVIDARLAQILQDKGFVIVGKGVDQHAYIDPNDGRVLKIFGTKDHSSKAFNPATGFTDDQMMFMEWAKFCHDNPHNKFLPQFLQWETFKFDGSNYLQIKMERLFKIPGFFKTGAQYLTGLTWESYTSAADMHRTIEQECGTDPTVLAFISHIFEDEQDLDLFFTTCEQLKKIARRHGWGWDISSKNMMLDDHGDLVIVDPWHVSWD